MARMARDPLRYSSKHARPTVFTLPWPISHPLSTLSMSSAATVVAWGSFRPGNFGEGGALDHEQSMTFIDLDVSVNDGGWVYADETNKGKWG